MVLLTMLVIALNNVAQVYSPMRINSAWDVEDQRQNGQISEPHHDVVDAKVEQ